MGELVCEEPEALVCEPAPLIEMNDGTASAGGASVVPPEVCEAPPTLDMTEGPQSVEITEPTLVKSTLGDMEVYPDSFVGPLPPGAVRASDHARMVSIMSGIETGTSQISIDTSNFTAGKDLFADPIRSAT